MANHKKRAESRAGTPASRGSGARKSGGKPSFGGGRKPFAGRGAPAERGPSSDRRVPVQRGPATDRLASFIAKFDPEVARLIESVRDAMRARFPTANELMYDNFNFFAIGYSSSERASDCIVSIAASATGVSLSFYYGSQLPDPDGILLGSGNQNRFVRIKSLSTLAEPAVEAMLRAATAHAPVPLPKSGRGRIIIKAVSAKQRPRRAT